MIRFIVGVFAFLASTVHATETVDVLLYGPSEEASRQLDQLPQAKAYKQITYRPPASKHSWKLLVGISGGIDGAEVPAILDAARIYFWPMGLDRPWKLYVHGGPQFSRVTVKYEGCSRDWLLLKDKGEWVSFDGPGTLVPDLTIACFDWIEPPMPMTTYEQSELM
jgi:hypothetical protein